MNTKKKINLNTKNMTQIKGTPAEDLINYLRSSVEALRIENAKLADENERLINNIEVIDAQIITHENNIGGYYNFIEQFNYQLKSKQND